jgi:hypothetical protein
MPSGTAEPVEARIAVASDPLSTRAWYSLRVESTAGDFGVVVPVPAGSSVDYGLPSFVEALEVASSPRIIPPTSTQVTCAASAGQPLVDVAGDLAPAVTLTPVETTILATVDDVRSWASSRGLTIPAALDARLSALGPSYFAVARFAAPSGVSRTRPLRVVSPGASPAYPLSLVVAGTQDVDVHAFAIGRHRATLAGTEASIDVASLSFDAAARTSNYDALLVQALGPPGAVVLQMSSHPSLRDSVPVDAPGATPIEAVARTYFARAAATGEATLDPDACTGQAAVILGQSAHLGTTCPRSAVGVAGGAAPCLDDVIDPGEVDPALLRCGALADDLAVALSDLEPDEAWLTRGAMRVPASNVGSDVGVTFPDSVVRLDPIVEAGKLDLSGCGDGGGTPGTGGGSGTGSGSGPSGSTGSGPSGSGSGGTVVEVPVYAHDGCACDGTWVLVDYVEVSDSDPPEAYYDESDSCSGDTTGTGDGSDTSIDSYSTSGDDCAGDTTGTAGDTTLDEGCSCDDTSGTSSDACSGDSSSSDACSGDSSSSDACSGDTGADDCAVRRESRASNGAIKARRKKLSVLVYGLLAIVIPLRRLTRKRIERKDAKKDAKKKN